MSSFRLAAFGVAAAAVLAGVAGAQVAEVALLPPAEYVAQRPVEAVPAPAPLPAAGLTLPEIESLALAGNPALAQAAAAVRAAQGRCVQAGLPPNPTAGYLGSEIGNDGEAGQQGFVVGQEFIRGNKLGLNRAVQSREIWRLQQELAAQHQRLRTDVRIAFYDAYLAQRRVELAESLNTVGRQSAATAKSLFDAAEGRRTDLLQAEIDSQRAAIDLAQAHSAHRGAWRRLAVLVGQLDAEPQPLAADVEALRWPCSWEESRDRLASASPELAAAAAEAARARAALARARVEPIPDVTAQASVQYDAATDYTIAGAQVTLPIPLWNYNQGGIAQANAELTAARHRQESVERRLEQELATVFQRYETAVARVDALKTQVLDRAAQSREVATQGYQAGELGFLDFLTVQRTYFQANLEYLTALGELNQSVQLLEGLLLSGVYEAAAQATIP